MTNTTGGAAGASDASGAKRGGAASPGGDMDRIVDTVIRNLPKGLREEVLKVADWRRRLAQMIRQQPGGGIEVSVEGSLRVGLDLLSQYAGREVRQLLRFRQEVLQWADRLGIAIPSIEGILRFDMSVLKDALSTLSLEEILSLDRILGLLEGELLKFLPAPLALALGQLTPILAEFGLPTDLRSAFRAATANRPEAPGAAAPAQSAATPAPPGVYVNKKLVARAGASYVVHKALPLAPGAGATSVRAMGAPIWRASADGHLCTFPDNCPHGVNVVKSASQDVNCEGFSIARHNDVVSDPACGSNEILTKPEADAAWKALQASMATLSHRGLPPSPSKGAATKGGAAGSSSQGDATNSGCTVVYEAEVARDIVVGERLSLKNTSFDPDTGGTAEAPNPGSFRSFLWGIFIGGKKAPFVSASTDLELDVVESLATEFQDVPENGRIAMVVLLSGIDAQGHQNERGRLFYVTGKPRPGVAHAVILLDGVVVARDGDHGIATLGLDENGTRLRSGSFVTGLDAKENRRLIKAATWTVTDPDGRPQFIGGGQLEYTFRKFGAHRVKLEVGGEDPWGKLVSASTQLKVDVAFPLEVEIVSVSGDGPTAIQHKRCPGLIVENDQVTVVAKEMRDREVDRFVWHISVGDRNFSQTTETGTVQFRLVDECGTWATKRRLTIEVEVWKDRVRSVRSSRNVEVYPELTAERVSVAVGKAVLELGIVVAEAIAVAFLAPFFGVGVPVTWAAVQALIVPSLAAKVVSQGLEDVGVDPALADLMGSGLEVKGAVIEMAVKRMKVQVVLNQIGNRIRFQRGADTFARWERAMRSIGDDTLPHLKNVAAREAFKEAMEEVIDSLGKTLYPPTEE